MVILIIPSVLWLSELALAIFDVYKVSMAPRIVDGGHICTTTLRSDYTLGVLFVALGCDFSILTFMMMRCVSLFKTHGETKLLRMITQQGSLIFRCSLRH